MAGFRDAHEMAVAARSHLPFGHHIREIERQIIVPLVENILAAGFAIEVNDGEEDVLRASRDAAAIFAAMSTTDEEMLFLYRGGEKPGDDYVHFGWIRLIYGNDEDVISDYTCNIEDNYPQVFTRANEIAERFGA